MKKVRSSGMAEDMRVDPQVLFDVLAPQLWQLCHAVAPFGSLNIRAEVHAGQVVRICAGTEISIKASPLPSKEEADK